MTLSMAEKSVDWMFKAPRTAVITPKALANGLENWQSYLICPSIFYLKYDLPYKPEIHLTSMEDIRAPRAIRPFETMSDYQSASQPFT